MNKLKLLLVSLCIVSVCGCTGLHSNDKDYLMRDVNGVYKIGGRYQINGVWYQPKEDFNYKQEGIASWYGEDFHKGTTANGETYNMYDMTASHKTLPLPSIVKVTNLENGKSTIVRVNDRGPFVNHRIIDVSKAVAKKLDFLDAGITRVRVEILEKESRELKKKILDNGGILVDGSPIAEQSPALTVKQNTVAPVSLLHQSAAVQPMDDNDVIYSPKKNTTPHKTVPTKSATVQRGYYVQVGAFKNYDNALRSQENFQKFGKTSVHARANGKDQLYRVRIGPFTDPESAVQLMDKIQTKTNHTDMRLVEEK